MREARPEKTTQTHTQTRSLSSLTLTVSRHLVVHLTGRHCHDSDPMDESAGAAAAPDIPSKVLKYEEFVNERLRPDLKQALDAEQEVANEMANCDQVCLLLRQFQQKEFTDKSELKVLTDIGCNFYTEAVV